MLNRIRAIYVHHLRFKAEAESAHSAGVISACQCFVFWLTRFAFTIHAAVMGEYEPKIEVQFPDTLRVSKGSSVKLECFALGK